MTRASIKTVAFSIFLSISVFGEEKADLILDHLKDLRENDVSIWYGQGNHDHQSDYSRLLTRLSSGRDLSQDNFLKEELGLEGVDEETLVTVLNEIWTKRLTGASMAFDGLLALNVEDAWAELETKLESDALTRGEAIDGLRGVQTERAIRTAAFFLDDNEIPGVGAILANRHSPVSYWAASVLSDLVPDGPTEDIDILLIKPAHVELWRDWRDRQNFSSLEKAEGIEVIQVKEIEENKTVKATEEDLEQSSNRWFWILVLVGFLTTLVFVIRLRKS